MAKRKPKRVGAGKAKKPIEPPELSDFGTTEFQEKYRDYLVTERAFVGIKHKRNTLQVSLDYYLTATKSLAQAQYEAGVCFHRDFVASGMNQRITPSYDGMPTTGGHNDKMAVSDKQYAARQRFRKAQEAIGGKIGRILALNVCCYGFLVRDLSLPYYREPKMAMARLKEALDDLIVFYGIPETKEANASP